ncbi:hypothetical protein [Actibacterium sp. XHP0104]|uniref:hypothetical protein n=1 Tax=Actibacterium sp. XHP0104 TaxID=2984335 RepID=UPI0021E92520|nr:hypothetical protein [Actibacterium sp. XHP0104]MCV2881888.1 hypothetical protein [Actibacterium sp. XHP0104]
MSLFGTRSEMEAALSGALSRYIGYTTGAYDLNRIFSTLDAFGDNPSLYRDEIVAFLDETDHGETEGRDQKRTSGEYRSEVLSFAKSMDLVETVSRRDARLERLAPTELGRTLNGARDVRDREFLKFFTAKLVFLADADALYPILKFYESSTSQDIQSYYQEFMRELRHRRTEWLHAAFPEAILRDRVANAISWLTPVKGRKGQYKIESISKNTARHHVTPRKGWLEDIGMFDRSNATLRRFGREAIASLEVGEEFFWLGPQKGLQTELGIPISLQAGEPYEDTWFADSNRLKPKEFEVQSLIDDVVRVMVLGYPASKLKHASQASLRLPIEYITFRSFKDQRSYDWQTVVDEVFKSRKSEVERFSAKKGSIGFYRPKVKQEKQN